MAPWGIYMEFGRRYDQSKFRNEFPDHENIGIGTLIKLVLAIVCVLCPFSRFRLMADHKCPPGGRFWNFFNFFFFLSKCVLIPVK